MTMSRERVPKPPSVASVVPPCSYISCGRVLEVENVAQRCPQCKSAYCSRGCRKSAEKRHSKICNQLAQGVEYSADPERDKTRWKTSCPESSKWSPPRGLECAVSVPFTKLKDGVWLYDRPKMDIFRILLDAYRLRKADAAAALGGGINPESAPDSQSLDTSPLRHFIDLVNCRDKLMPPWWRDFNRVECEKMASRTDKAEWYRLCAEADENLMKEHYQDETFPMQLRIFAEFVYGTPVGVISTKEIMEEMAFGERLMHSFTTG